MVELTPSFLLEYNSLDEEHQQLADIVNQVTQSLDEGKAERILCRGSLSEHFEPIPPARKLGHARGKHSDLGGKLFRLTESKDALASEIDVIGDFRPCFVGALLELNSEPKCRAFALFALYSYFTAH